MYMFIFTSNQRKLVLSNVNEEGKGNIFPSVVEEVIMSIM